MNELKCCPFCGKTNMDVTTESDFNLMQSKSGKACLAIRCWDCYVEMYDHTYTEKDYNKRREMLVSKWNRRVSDE